MSEQFFESLLSEAVSLFVLAVVLFGLYKLTNRFLDVFSQHIERCCATLDRIADAQETRTTK